MGLILVGVNSHVKDTRFILALSQSLGYQTRFTALLYSKQLLHISTDGCNLRTLTKHFYLVLTSVYTKNQAKFVLFGMLMTYEG